ncbi:MAG: hypothetical protein Q8P58_00170 [Candidatus Adlerbacteria bacterium]|nr:hypothetical protein [Candidatus Adlerbacteria bacterium]MDZ4225986.1 hypothetical protein [Patescibacteria group bacterium]
MKNLLKDLFFVAISVAVAISIVQSGIIHTVVDSGGDGGLVTSFVAGVFFTSIFTAAPATAILAELAEDSSLFVVVIMGSLGAVLGDYVLYLFLRNRLLRDASQIPSKSRLHRIIALLRRRRYHRLTQLLGILILATPLPDEPALALLGLSSISRGAFFILSFTTHAVGILAIGLIARAI